MRYYVEIHTARADGAAVIERVRLASESRAEQYAEIMFRKFELVAGIGCQNDFGEEVHIVVTQHGERSQVREGVTVL